MGTVEHDREAFAFVFGFFACHTAVASEKLVIIRYWHRDSMQKEPADREKQRKWYEAQEKNSNSIDTYTTTQTLNLNEK